MKDDSKLAALLRSEKDGLVEQRDRIQGSIDAIDLLLGDALFESAAALDAADAERREAPPKQKRKRRTNAEIAADKAMAELAAKERPGEVAELTDEDERTNSEAAQ